MVTGQRKRLIESEFSAKLRKARLASGLSLQEAADRCEMSIQQFGDYERGKREPGYRMLRWIFHRLEFSPAEFFEGDPPQRDTSSRSRSIRRGPNPVP